MTVATMLFLGPTFGGLCFVFGMFVSTVAIPAIAGALARHAARRRARIDFPSARVRR